MKYHPAYDNANKACPHIAQELVCTVNQIQQFNRRIDIVSQFLKFRNIVKLVSNIIP